MCKCDDWQATRRAIVEEVRHSAYHIIDYKGTTWFAVAMALTQIAAAILRNQRSVLTVSAVLDGEYGLSGISLGVPCVVSWKGVEQVLEVALPQDEQSALAKSAATLRRLKMMNGLSRDWMRFGAHVRDHRKTRIGITP